MKFLPALLLFLMACSTYVSESIEEKIARFESRPQLNSIVPDLQVFPYQGKAQNNSRRPASISTENNNDVDSAKEQSNKRLYFMALYWQYQNLKSYAKASTPEISICPNFNTGLVRHREKYGNRPLPSQELKILFSKDPAQWDNYYLSLFPELSLPIAKESAYPTLADLLKNQGENAHDLLQASVDLHTLKTYQELHELCETGFSSNYYVFENLTTYIKTNSPFQINARNIKALLKTTIYSNASLMNSLQQVSPRGRQVASMPENPYIKEIDQRLSISWIEDYFKEIRNHRK